MLNKVLKQAKRAPIHKRKYLRIYRFERYSSCTHAVYAGGRAILVAALVMALSGSAAFADEKLAAAKGCMACHKVDVKVVGPAYKDVAAKYKDDANAVETLAAKVKAGGKGVWGEVPMPPQVASSDEDLKTLVTWIMTH